MSSYDTTEINFTLPVKPISVNSYYGHITRGKTVIKYIKTAGKDFKRSVKDFVLQNKLDLQINIPITVHVILHFPTNHRTDIDNPQKALLDSLVEARVIDDDSLINELHIYRSPKPPEKPGSIQVIIEEYDQPVQLEFPFI